MERGPPALGVWTLGLWITREVPKMLSEEFPIFDILTNKQTNQKAHQTRKKEVITTEASNLECIWTKVEEQVLRL